MLSEPISNQSLDSYVYYSSNGIYYDDSSIVATNYMDDTDIDFDFIPMSDNFDTSKSNYRIDIKGEFSASPTITIENLKGTAVLNLNQKVPLLLSCHQ